MEQKLKNRHETREGWCRALKMALDPHFSKHGYPLPDKIRYAVAFTSQGRKGKSTGETLFPDASADQHHEIIVRCDKDDPIEVAGVVMHQLVHVVIGSKDHNAKFREACLKLGMDVEDGLRKAMPGRVFREERLKDIVAQLGPLPHARINLDALAMAADRPKKQSTRNLKVFCATKDCDLIIRMTAKSIRKFGALHCPQHGPMQADMPEGDEDEILQAAE